MTISASKVFFAAAFVAYPVLVYLGLLYFDARAVAVLLILLAAARLAFATRSTRRLEGHSAFTPQLLFALATATAIGFLVLLSGSSDYLLFYPVCINGLMLVLFVLSLLRPPTIIERFARLQDPALPESAVRYTRNVTIVWCLFFVLNGSAALYTALFTSLETWTLYNGSIAYGLMGALFAVEYLVRRRVQKRALA